MMGHRARLINGDEYDYLTKGGRAVHRPKAGRFSRVKRAFNRRMRKAARLEYVAYGVVFVIALSCTLP